jgi:hypothetical protein
MKRSSDVASQQREEPALRSLSVLLTAAAPGFVLDIWSQEHPPPANVLSDPLAVFSTTFGADPNNNSNQAFGSMQPLNWSGQEKPCQANTTDSTLCLDLYLRLMN